MSFVCQLWQIVALSIRHVVRMIVTNVLNECIGVWCALS